MNLVKKKFGIYIYYSKIDTDSAKFSFWNACKTSFGKNPADEKIFLLQIETVISDDT